MSVPSARNVTIGFGVFGGFNKDRVLGYNQQIHRTAKSVVRCRSPRFLHPVICGVRNGGINV